MAHIVGPRVSPKTEKPAGIEAIAGALPLTGSTVDAITESIPTGPPRVDVFESWNLFAYSLGHHLPKHLTRARAHSAAIRGAVR